MSPARFGYWKDPFAVVRGAVPDAGRHGRLVVVFQCYLDDSGTSDLPIVTMAGFIGPLQNFEHLEPIWDESLNRYGVPILHAKEFHDTDGVFKGWSKVKKRSMAEELFSAAHGKIKGMGISVRKAAYEAEKKETGLLPTMSAYGVCFSALMFNIVAGHDIGAAVRSDGVSFAVESGNKNNDELEKSFAYWADTDHFRSSLRSISFIPKNACRAIQVADFFAFYIRRYLRDHDRFDGKLSLPSSPYLQTMNNHVPIWARVATSFLKKPVGNIKDLPTFDDTSFWQKKGRER